MVAGFPGPKWSAYLKKLVLTNNHVDQCGLARNIAKPAIPLNRF